MVGVEGHDDCPLENNTYFFPFTAIESDQEYLASVQGLSYEEFRMISLNDTTLIQGSDTDSSPIHLGNSGIDPDINMFNEMAMSKQYIDINRVVNATLKKYRRYRYRYKDLKVAALPLPLLKFKSSGATATSATATLLRNSYNKVAYATELNLPFLSQTSTSSRRSYMKHSLRVKITIIFSSIHLNLSLHYDIFVNPASTYMYYSSGSQPFPTRGPLYKFCLGSRTTKKFLHFLGKISEFLNDLLKSFSLKSILGSRTTKKNFANFPNFLCFFQGQGQKRYSNFHLQSSSDTIHEKVPSLSSQFRLKPT